MDLELGVRFQNVNAGSGEDDDLPDVRDRFDERTLPGLGSRDLTNAASVALAYDSRRPRLDPWRGGYLALRVEAFGRALGDGDVRFNRTTIEAAWLFTRVEDRLALGVRGVFVATDGGRGRVPFYELAHAGGPDTLRGFFDRRFVERASLSLNAELRFPVWRFFSGAVFADAGRVFGRASHVTLRDLHWDGGAGVRFVIHPSIVVRLDVAHSREQTAVWLAWGQLF